MATGTFQPAVKSKKVTGTTSGTGSLVIDLAGINKVLSARSRTPNAPDSTEWRYVTIIRGDNYPQVLTMATSTDRMTPVANTYVEIELFYI